jgi:hypothetical protein
MRNELQIELTSDQLDLVTGGLTVETKTTIMNILAVVPVLGAVTQTARAFANVIRTAEGRPIV